MCPNCKQGLVNGELCPQCAGTGFWNPQSLSVNEVKIMQENEQAASVEGVAEDTVVEVPAEPVGEVVAQDVEAVPAVEVMEADDAGVQAAPSEEPEEVVA